MFCVCFVFPFFALFLCFVHGFLSCILNDVHTVNVIVHIIYILAGITRFAG